MKLENRKLTIEAGDEYGHYKFNGVDAISGKSATLEFDYYYLVLRDGDTLSNEDYEKLEAYETKLKTFQPGEYIERGEWINQNPIMFTIDGVNFTGPVKVVEYNDDPEFEAMYVTDYSRYMTYIKNGEPIFLDGYPT